MELKNVLIFHKKSAYKIYFLERKETFHIKNKSLIQKELNRFKKAHDEHYATLKVVEDILRAQKIRFAKIFRGQKVNFDEYDLVITIGGDGTFLEAARSVGKSVLLGVNSSLTYSVGKFCVGNSGNFETILQSILRKNFQAKQFHRVRLDIDGIKGPIDCLNDVLVCHENPAAMSRYVLKIGKVKEEHRSSGIWIATPSGSSGAIHSAGGKLLAHTAKKIQYMPRELYGGGKWSYQLKGGVLSGSQSIKVISLMRQGKIYIDGTHLDFPFPFGVTMDVSLSKHPVKTIDVM